MWRGFFLAIGVALVLLGVQCLIIDKAVLVQSSDPYGGNFGFARSPVYREFEPPPWAAWSLLSVGAVVCLYSFTIPRKLKG